MSSTDRPTNCVGIIANPASGRDIRRLVAHGTVFDNEEKVNIVRRLLLGLDSVGVERVWIMPESYEIGRRALDGIQLKLQADILPMPVHLTQEDSKKAAALMVEESAGCITTLGGDGTNRAVAKTCGRVPLMPISTGTNNTFPIMIEGTIAGLAAGLVACGKAGAAVHYQPRLEVFVADNGREPDEIALVDAALYDERFVGSRAIWEASKIKAVVLAKTRAGTIGLSSIGALARAAHSRADGSLGEQAVYLRFAPGGKRVLAPIAPGIVQPLSIIEQRSLSADDEVVIEPDEASVLAYDGERETVVPSGTSVRIRLNAAGPRVVNPQQAIDLAARDGFFIRSD